MTSTPVPDQARIDALLGHLTSAGYVRCHPPLLQKASVFLDMAGEDIRGRLFLTSDAAGAEFCLRPELTIPVCLEYLASAQAGTPASFCSLGPVFRIRPNAPGEFVQAGLESFGRADAAAADAEVLALSLEAVAAAGGPELAVTLGDAGLFASMVAALQIAPVWQRRIMRGHARGQTLDAILQAVVGPETHDHSGVLAALEGADKAGARALVQDLLSIAGISTVGGRSAGEIADRFLEQSALRAGTGFPADKRAIFERFLAIAADPDSALAQLRQLASQHNLDMQAALDEFDARLGFLTAHGVDVAQLHFATGFVRKLDYYTGFVFEAREVGRPESKPVIGGGRYDRLLASLNGGQMIPAVGAAIWIERLLEHAA